MFSFSLLGDIYKKLYQKLLIDDLHVDVCLNRAVCSVRRTIQSSSSSSVSSLIIVTDQHGVVEVFDKVIFACDAETVLKTLVYVSSGCNQ
jgi:predicted NAD/FAD-binding protein